MAEELKQAPDYAPIDPSVLEVYQLPGDEVVTTSMAVEEVVTEVEFPSESAPREYEVEIEYRSEDVALEDESFVRYLDSFEQANISHEMIARIIELDLRNALGVDDVFVEVHREAPAQKRTRIGAIV